MPETDNQTEVTPSAAPGQVITPGGVSPAPEQAEPPAPDPETPTHPASPKPDDYQPDSDDQSAEPAPPAEADGDVISWKASEFAGHQKSAGWYVMLALAAVILAALIYLLTRDIISTVVVLVGSAIFGFYGGRQPNDVQYQMDSGGLMIGNKYHSFDEFRSFAQVQDNGHASIILAPLKRFAPLTTVYYNSQDEENIVNLLADRLPMEEHRHDAIDRLMNRIRF